MAVYSKEMHQTSQEILDFADLVFSLSSGSTDFEAILPKAYSQARQHIVTHHVMREKGSYTGVGRCVSADTGSG